MRKQSSWCTRAYAQINKSFWVFSWEGNCVWGRLCTHFGNFCVAVRQACAFVKGVLCVCVCVRMCDDFSKVVHVLNWGQYSHHSCPSFGSAAVLQLERIHKQRKRLLVSQVQILEAKCHHFSKSTELSFIYCQMLLDNLVSSERRCCKLCVLLPRWAAPYVPIPFHHVSVHNMSFFDRTRLFLSSCQVHCKRPCIWCSHFLRIMMIETWDFDKRVSS